jgi:hypothetical protein
MTRFSLLLLATAMVAPPASAATAIYMTGSSSPWGIGADDKGSPEAAMDFALGKKAWQAVYGFTTDAFAGASFVYIEGGDSAGLADFLNNGGRKAIESFVQAGGAVLVNAARNDSFDALDAGFGLTLTGERLSAVGKLTDAGEALRFDRRGAGDEWEGNYFSHDAVSCALVSCKSALSLIKGSEGSTLMGGAFGDGYLMVGGMTSPYWQSKGGMKLRANIIDHAAAQGSVVEAQQRLMAAVVPEPASWTLMIAGFGLIGAAARRRQIGPAPTLS